MNPIKAVLWDMDGTLVDSEVIGIAAFRLAMLEAALEPPADLHQRASGRSSDDLYRWMVEEFGLTSDVAHWESRKHHHYFRAVDGLKGFGEAVDSWQRFSAAGIAQAVVSNSDRMIMDVNLAAAGLARPGLVTVARNDVRKGKPDPEGYLRAAWLLGVEPEECVIVEDSTSGAAAGLASGMRTFFVPHSTMMAPAGVTPLASMAELEALVLPTAVSAQL
jgi:HAD superfamily hydrolase (TIGR01509 family)